MKRMSVLSSLLLLSTPVLLTACPNVYDPLDTPTSDAQILSAARAEFDKGNLTEARTLYEKLGNNDSAEAELAFVDLNDAGITMATLVSAIRISSGESVGSILTKLSESIEKASGDSSTKRTKLATAYARVSGIENQQLRGFVRFLVGISIASEVLSENTGISADGILDKSDIVQTPASCLADTSCATSSGCDIKTGSGISVGTSTQSTTFTSDTSTAVTLTSATYVLMTDALLGATKGLDEMVVSTGDAKTLSTDLNTYATALSSSQTTAAARCFLAALVNTVKVGQ